MWLFQTFRRFGPGAAAAVCAAGLWLATEAIAQDAPSLEYQVKAAYLLKFTAFVQWPPSAFADAQSPLAICLLDGEPFGNLLDQMVEGETLNGRKVIVRHIHQEPEPKTCQVVFLPASSHGIEKTLSKLDPGVLTVGEEDVFLHEGGVIAFVIADRRVRFDINQKAAAAEQLALSSRLLSVARNVER